MMYGVITDGGIIAYNTQVPNSKPMIESEINCPENYRPVYRWVDQGEFISQEVTYIPLTQEEIEDNKKHEQTSQDIDDSEALEILLGGDGT
jgi:hypothetical protein